VSRIHPVAIFAYWKNAFKCKACDYRNNADVVGSINILRLGHSWLTCGEKLLNVVDIGTLVPKPSNYL